MDSRLKDIVFSPCKSPVRVERNGVVSYFPCGHCQPCLVKRSRSLTFRVSEEVKSSRFTLFFTLTYDNKHIPLVRWNDYYGRWIPDYLEIDKFNAGSNSVITPSDYLHEYFLPSEFGKDAFHPRVHNLGNDSVFGCVCKSDVVKFIKRLRVNLCTLLNQEAREIYYTSLSNLFLECFSLKKVTNYMIRKMCNQSDSFKKRYYELKKEKSERIKSWRSELFRYFIVSEYGPTRKDGPSYHRPHYHGLFFTESATVLRLLPVAIRKSWKMCDKRNIDTSIVTERNAAGYVAKYVNGNSSLPRILRAKPIRTFYLSSRRTAQSFLSYTPEKLTEMYNRGTATTVERRFKANGTFEDVDVSVPTFVISRYFPKCKGYSTLSFGDKLRVYSRFFSPTEADKEMTKGFYKDYSIYPRYEKIHPYLSVITQLSDFNSMDINAARACANWCNVMKCTPERYLEILDWFYYKREMYKLEQQYLLADEHPTQLYDMTVFDDLPEYLGNDFFYRCFGLVPPECRSLYVNTEVDCIDDRIIKLRFSRFGRALWDICGVDVSHFYDAAGFLDRSLLDDLLESSQPYYIDYLNDISDEIVKSDKSKVLNDDMLNNVY